MSKNQNQNQNQETKQLKIAINSTKKETFAASNFQKFKKYLKNFASLGLITDKMTLEKLKKVNLVIIGGPRSYFSGEELDILTTYIEEGGSILILLGEGGEEKNNTNLNQFIERYGISFFGDSVVRTSYYKYLHPKECFIDSCRVHTDFLNSIKFQNKKKKVILNDDILDDNITAEDDSNLKLVYPYGQSLTVDVTTSVIFNSGIVAYPANRPLAACNVSKNKKGKLFVMGSERFFDDEFFEKEENKKITDGILKWLLGIARIDLDKPSRDVDIAEYVYIPNMISLSDQVKSCLEDVKEPPRNFNELFDMNLFKFDNNLVPEALELYEKVNVKHETLTIIPPQFETPLPPLQLAVFDPILKDFPAPSLELFDLDEQFASEKIKLAQVTNKCNDEDLDYYIKECSDILGITGKIDNKNDPKAILYYVFNQLVTFKKLNP